MKKFDLKMKNLFFTLAFLGLCFQVDAATIKWDGDAGDNDWMTASNWVGDVLPSATDDVLLDLSGGGTIDLGSAAAANVTVMMVEVKNSWTLHVGAMGVLNIDGGTADDLLETAGSGKIINDGEINISNAGSGRDGIDSKGTITNNKDITISTGLYGIYIREGSFINSANATVTLSGSTEYGIRVDDNSGSVGSFQNFGTVDVMSAGTDGIYINDGASYVNMANATTEVGAVGDQGIVLKSESSNGASFTNMAMATLEIGGTSNDQIWLDGTTSFTNSGMMDLIGGGDIGIYVTDASTFTNTSNSILNISSVNKHGIQIDANSLGASVSNSGNITMTGGGNDGLRMQEGAGFTNAAGATLSFVTIGNSSDDAGIQLDDPSSFTNSGTIDLASTAGHGMECFGTFTNMDDALYQADGCGTVDNGDGIRMQNSGTFANSGDIRIDNSIGEDIETETAASFTNTGTATFAPGSSPGDLEIKDDFNLGGATVTFEITGTGATSDYDQILNTSSTNTLGLAGSTAHLDWGAFVPAVGDCFKIVDGSGLVTGTFAFTTSNAAISIDVTYPGTEVIVCVVLDPAPVELLHFTGVKSDRGTELSWATANEIDNEGFDIERRTDTKDWSKIGEVRGNGNSYATLEYAFVDKTPAEGNNYYRLKQKDFDGNFDYSNTVALHFEFDKIELAFHPNPVEDVLYIKVNQEIENLQIQLLNSNGQILWVNKGMVQQIPFEEYGPGVYFISVLSSTDRTIHKVIKNNSN